MSHLIRILVIKYEAERHIYSKLNKTNLFKEKWKIFEKTLHAGAKNSLKSLRSMHIFFTKLCTLP